MQQIISMEGPRGSYGRHLDPALFGDISHEKLVLSEWMKTENFDQGSLLGCRRVLEISNFRGNFTGLRAIFLFRLLGEERTLLGPGGSKASEATGTYAMRPSSTTSEIRTPGFDAVSLRWVPP